MTKHTLFMDLLSKYGKTKRDLIDSADYDSEEEYKIAKSSLIHELHDLVDEYNEARL